MSVKPSFLVSGVRSTQLVSCKTRKDVGLMEKGIYILAIIAIISILFIFTLVTLTSKDNIKDLDMEFKATDIELKAKATFETQKEKLLK